MKKIDAHAHIGYYGSFFNVGIKADEMVKVMDEFEISKTVVSDLYNEGIRNAVQNFPDRLLGALFISLTALSPS